VTDNDVQTEADALEVRLDELERKHIELEQKYIELARYLQRDVFPRLDRIENEMQIDA
jgi:3-dehydroquinate dehydratase